MDEELDKNFEIRNFNASFSVSAIVSLSVMFLLILISISENMFEQLCKGANSPYSLHPVLFKTLKINPLN